MKYHTTIEINNSIKQIILKPALYKELSLWEITLDEKNYIVKKSEHGWEDITSGDLSTETLNKIGEAIEYLPIKDAG